MIGALVMVAWCVLHDIFNGVRHVVVSQHLLTGADANNLLGGRTWSESEFARVRQKRKTCLLAGGATGIDNRSSFSTKARLAMSRDRVSVVEQTDSYAVELVEHLGAIRADLVKTIAVYSTRDEVLDAWPM